MKFTEAVYSNKKEILKFPDHYVNIAVTVSDQDAITVDGKKIVPAGTILGGGFLADDTVEATRAETTEEGVSNAEGILFNDVDVTHGPAKGAALIHGFVAIDKLPEAPTAEEVAALKQITFIK